MQVTTSNFQYPVRNDLSKFTQNEEPKPSNDPQQPEPQESFSLIGAGLTVLSRAADSGIYYYGGGGTMAGTMQFGALVGGVNGAIEGGILGYQRGEGSKLATAGGAALGGAFGAGTGALKGWSTYVLASAFGGGVGGAVMAGAALGVGEVAADALFGKK
jgi:hypothetical protein